MLRKAREDGISKKNKLKTKSIRSRVAAIPSRCSEERKVAMQIRGSASRRVDVQGVEGNARSRVSESSTSCVRASPQREDRMSHSNRSSSSQATPRRECSTKASLGNHYPPLLPSNASENSSLPPAQVALPTDTPGPRSSTPANSQQASTSSQFVPSPTQIIERISVASSSASLHRTTQREMGSILSAATVRVLDPFDDDEDDDAMRRLCASPVLHPDNSVSASLVAVANAPLSLRIPETQNLASGEPLISPLQNCNATGKGVDAGKVNDVEGYEVKAESKGRSMMETAVPRDSVASPNQRIYFKAEDAPNIKSGSAATSSREVPKAVAKSEMVEKLSSNAQSAAASSSEVQIASGSGSGNRRITLEDRLLALEEALAAAQSSAVRTHQAQTASQSSASHTTSGSGSSHSKESVSREKPTLDDRIAYLESLVFKADKPAPQLSVAPTPTILPVLQTLTPRLAATHPKPAEVASPIPVLETRSASERSMPQRYYAPPSPAKRRASSASSESYEPASPAHTASPEFADFGPGEFVLSTEALEAHAASFIAPVVSETTLLSDEVATGAANAKEAAAEPEDDEDEDAPYFPPTRIQLPSNQDIPPLYNHGAIRKPSPRSEPTRAYASSAHLRHPTPRQGNVTPTASRLEESANSRSTQPVEVDNLIEYEEQPVDIAARSVKPRRESTTKVKFADAEEEAEEMDSSLEKGDEEMAPAETEMTSQTSATKREVSATPVGVTNDRSLGISTEPVAEFEFEETDILKGITMPSLARSSTESSSDDSDSETQPESPAEYVRPTSMSGSKRTVPKKDGANNTSSPTKPSKATSASPASRSVKRPSSAGSSRSSSPSGHSNTSDSDESEAEKEKLSAATKVSAPPIRWGGSLMKKEGRKAGFNQPRFSQRYGMHSGYSGPARTFRAFEYPTGPSGWRGSAAVDAPLPAVHPETAYDVAQEQGGNVALASFIENYEPAIEAAEMSSRADLEDALPTTLLPAKKNISIRGASSRAKEKKRENSRDKSELDIFDELLASI